jgi:hypothetical protein
VSQDHRPVFQLNPVHAVGKRLGDDPLHELGALGHELRLYQTYRSCQQEPLTLPSPRRGEGVS